MNWRSWLIAVSFLLLSIQSTRSTKTKRDDLVDPYAWDYDRTTKTNRGTVWIKQSGEVDCSSDRLKAACAGCSFDSPGESPPQDTEPCGPDDIHLFRHVARSISEHFEGSPNSDSLVLTLSSRSREKLRRFVDGEDVPKVNIKDMLEYSWSVPSDHASSEPYRIAGHTMNEVINAGLIILLFASIFLMVMTFHVSLLRVIFALCFTAVIVSFFWSYMFLYQKKIAERMADDALREEYHKICKSSEKDSIFSGLTKLFRRDDACERYFHDHQVHIAWEVLPVEAVTHTFGAIMTSISGFFGESLGGMSGGFLGSLSYAMWLPATLILLIFVVAILAVCLYCGGRRQQVIVREHPYRGIQEVDRMEQLQVHNDYDARRREERRDDRPILALPREADDPRSGAYARGGRIEERPPQREAAGGKGREDTDNMERHPQQGTVDDRAQSGHVQGHPDRHRADKPDLRYRGGSQARDTGDGEWSGGEGSRGGQRPVRRVDGNEADTGKQQSEDRTVSSGSSGDGVEQGVRALGTEVVSDGSCTGGRAEERVEEVAPKDQPQPESPKTGPKLASSETMDPAEEDSSGDDFEVISEPEK